MSGEILHLKRFVPAVEGEELEHRLTLLRARDYAASMLANTATDKAYAYAHDVHELAGRFVFADAEAEQLQLAAKCCRHLIMAALQIQRIDAEGGLL